MIKGPSRAEGGERKSPGCLSGVTAQCLTSTTKIRAISYKASSNAVTMAPTTVPMKCAILIVITQQKKKGSIPNKVCRFFH